MVLKSALQASGGMDSHLQFYKNPIKCNEDSMPRYACGWSSDTNVIGIPLFSDYIESSLCRRKSMSGIINPD